MSSLKPLEPAISVQCPPAELIATEAARTDKGLAASVQVFNGSIVTILLVRFAMKKDCLHLVEEARRLTGAPENELLIALIRLGAAVEIRLRERTEVPPPREEVVVEPLTPEEKEKYGEFAFWRSEDHLYLVHKGSTFRVSYDKDGNEHRAPLANFAAIISEETALDDGVEVTRYYTLRGLLRDGRPLHAARVAVAKFTTMSWPAEAWGAGPSLGAGLGVRDHVRASIEEHSGMAVPRESVFTHLGMRKIGSDWVFLHGGGAIGAERITVDIDSELQCYTLPPSPLDPKEAMRLSLSFLELGDHRITYPLWASIWRAPVSEWLPFLSVLWLLGETGQFKSTVAALILSHYGERFDTDHLPASWMDTENRLEQKAFFAKDVPIVVDDYTPERHVGLSQELERRASRVIRSVGNRQGRSRMRSDLSARKAYVPRGILISTAEQLPHVVSSALARILPIPFQRGSIDKEKLSTIQKAKARLPEALRGFLDDILPRGDALKEALPLRFEELRGMARLEGHNRLPEAVAHTFLGMELGVTFAAKIGVLSQREAEMHLERAWSVIFELAQAHGRALLDERPSRKFLDAIREGLVTGRAWLANRLSGKVARGSDGPGAHKLGWVDEKGIYLLPGASYEFASDRLRNRSDILLGEKALHGMLRDEGLLIFEKNGRLTPKPRCEGIGTRVLHLKLEALEEIEEVDAVPPSGEGLDPGDPGLEGERG